jgi:hypothetical protein
MIVLAHAFGARYDLPIPLLLFVLGGGVVVVLSFALLAGRGGPATVDVTTPAAVDAGPLPRISNGWGVAAVTVLALLVWVGFAGSQEVAENILPTAFWLLVWIAGPLTCGVVGDWTQRVNPFAFLAALADNARLRRTLFGSPEPVAWPRRLGWWPVVMAYFAIACGELIFNITMTVPANTALALVVYAVITVFGGLVFGPAWLRYGEVFTVLFATWGRLGFFRFGAPGRRGFAGGVSVGFEPVPSRIWFVLLLLVSVNFDGLLATPSWNRLEGRAPAALSTHPGRLEAFRSVSFLLLALGVAVLFGLFAMAAARMGGRRGSPAAGLAELLPSLLPIAFGYLLVHNLQYVLVNSQLMAPLIGNPIGKDSWPLHLPYPFNDSYEVHNAFLPSAFYWYAGVVVIVAVHVVAVVIAHHRLVGRAAAPAVARRSEYPWLAAMVGYTMISLWLIAQPLVTEKAPAAQPSAATVSTTSSGTSSG